LINLKSTPTKESRDQESFLLSSSLQINFDDEEQVEYDHAEVDSGDKEITLEGISGMVVMNENSPDRNHIVDIGTNDANFLHQMDLQAVQTISIDSENLDKMNKDPN